MMIHLLFAFSFRIVHDILSFENKKIDNIISKYISAVRKKCLYLSIFLLGLSSFIFFKDTLPHVTIAVAGSAYFFCFSVILSRSIIKQQSAIYGLSMGVIIAMPFIHLDRLI